MAHYSIATFTSTSRRNGTHCLQAASLALYPAVLAVSQADRRQHLPVRLLWVLQEYFLPLLEPLEQRVP